MTASITQIQTPKAERYLQQLCKHFGHKVPVEFDNRHGSITLPFGTCTLTAKDEALTMSVSGDDIAKLEQVIASHFERFAFRETVKVTWERSVSA